MKRRHWSTRDRAKLLIKHGGTCHLCGGRIAAGQAWEVSHDRPLALLGADDDENAKPAHTKCHRAHTAAVDRPMIDKAKRVEAKHNGAEAPSRRKIQSRGFRPAPPQRRATSPIVRKADRLMEGMDP